MTTSQNNMFCLNSHYLTNNDSFTKTKNQNTKLEGYNAYKGNYLAKIALKNCKDENSNECAKYVKYDIAEAGLGIHIFGDAYQMADNLRKNYNFKEISPDDVDVKELPAGCVLVYNKGTEGYDPEYGHTEITTGDGKAVSDSITEELNIKPDNIFIPV